MDPENFLYSLSRFGIKLGLEPTTAFARKLGNPQEYFRCVHVAGSNGKGSTTTFIYQILNTKFISGLYVSPHIRNFTERIIVSEKEIEWKFIENFIKKHETKIKVNNVDVQLTFFEYTTAMAFQYFREKDVEFAAVEVGLGGRLDSTNILNPEMSVITSISLEHADKLGGNIEDIAREKGGIIKRDKPVLLGKMPDKAKVTLSKIATEKNSKIIDIDDVRFENVELDIHGTAYTLKTDKEKYNVRLKSLGNHQVLNSAMALIASENLDTGISKEAALSSLKDKVVPGRFEIRREDPLIVVDGAHNTEAMRTLTSNIKQFRIKNPLVVLGMLRDKNSFNILQELSQVTDRVIVTEPNEKERRKTASQLRSEASFFFKDVEMHKLPEEAINAALSEGTETVITGSLYLVGEAEKILDKRITNDYVPLEDVPSK